MPCMPVPACLQVLTQITRRGRKIEEAKPCIWVRPKRRADEMGHGRIERGTYLIECIFTFQGAVEQTSVDDRDKCMALDMRRKREISVWLLYVPLLLELGGGFAIICTKKNEET